MVLSFVSQNQLKGYKLSAFQAALRACDKTSSVFRRVFRRYIAAEERDDAENFHCLTAYGFENSDLGPLGTNSHRRRFCLLLRPLRYRHVDYLGLPMLIHSIFYFAFFIFTFC